MQGRLRSEEALSFAVRTECAHCARPINLELDGELNYRVVEQAQGADPLVFLPFVDFDQLAEPSIIDAF